MAMGMRFWCWATGGLLVAGGVCWSAHRSCCLNEMPAAAAQKALAGPGTHVSAVPLPCPPGFEGTPSASLAASQSGSPAAGDQVATASYGPAPIVIREEEPPIAEQSEAPAETQQPAADGKNATQGGGPADPERSADSRANESAPLSPPTMPYCSEDTALPQAKPKADGAEMAREPEFSWADFLKAFASVLAPAMPTQPVDPRTKCAEDIHYYDHYSGCPYTGPQKPSAPATRNLRHTDPDTDNCSPTPLKGQDLSQRPHARPLSHKAPRVGHSDVDTMEYRPSDGGLNEYGTGPH